LKVYICNDGCVEGQLSSTCVELFLKKHRLTIVTGIEKADLIIFYACGLTELRQQQSLEIINNIKKTIKPTAKLIVWGCLSKINPEALRKIYDGPMIGPMDTNFFTNLTGDGTAKFDNMDIGAPINLLIPSITSGIQKVDPFIDKLLFFEQNLDRLFQRARKDTPTPFIIRVAKGCTGTCTYCSEHLAFGRIKSRAISNVLNDFTTGLQQGYRLFSLMATDLGAYGQDIGCSLPDLLEKMLDLSNGSDCKIVLNQVNPFHLKNLYPDLERIFESGRIDTLCSPVQSGSDRLLRLMHRPHTAEEWRSYMMLIRQKFPKIRLVTQFMVGFPTETEKDFIATERLLAYPLWFDYVHVFKFSPRPHVPASFMFGQVPEHVKEIRRRRLLRRHALTKGIGMLTKETLGIF